jgi:hypothetical protein
VRNCVLSRNLGNEEALVPWGLLCQKNKQINIFVIVPPRWWKTISVPCHKPYIISVVHIQIFLYSHSKFGFKTIYQCSLSFQILYSTVGPCFILLYFTFSSSIAIWVVMCFTAAKVKCLTLFVLGLSLCKDANIFILMILNDLYMLPA